MTLRKKIFMFFVYLFAVIGFVLTVGYFAIRYGLTNTSGIIDTQKEHFYTEKHSAWQTSPEWQVLKSAIVKDIFILNKASEETGVPARLILINLAGEQMRLFHTDREIFKSVFAPLKILGNETQFSWGVMGFKEHTAELIEEHLASTTSPYYLGEKYAHVLDFKTSDHATERFERLTADHDRYYSYLYAGLYIKQILTQWRRAGFPLNDRPEIIATLFNIGFGHSKPNARPNVGGASIEIGDTTYSFGGLAGEIYNSDELIEYFPK